MDNGPGGAIYVSGWLVRGARMGLVQTTFADNISTFGDGMVSASWNAAAVEIRGTDLIVIRNEGLCGAAWLQADDLLECTNCVFGSAPDDNVPLDATKDGVGTAQLPLDFTL